MANDFVILNIVRRCLNHVITPEEEVPTETVTFSHLPPYIDIGALRPLYESSGFSDRSKRTGPGDPAFCDHYTFVRVHTIDGCSQPSAKYRNCEYMVPARSARARGGQYVAVDRLIRICNARRSHQFNIDCDSFYTLR